MTCDACLPPIDQNFNYIDIPPEREAGDFFYSSQTHAQLKTRIPSNTEEVNNR